MLSFAGVCGLGGVGWCAGPSAPVAVRFDCDRIGFVRSRVFWSSRFAFANRGSSVKKRDTKKKDIKKDNKKRGKKKDDTSEEEENSGDDEFEVAEEAEENKQTTKVQGYKDKFDCQLSFLKGLTINKPFFGEMLASAEAVFTANNLDTMISKLTPGQMKDLMTLNLGERRGLHPEQVGSALAKVFLQGEEAKLADNIVILQGLKKLNTLGMLVLYADKYAAGNAMAHQAFVRDVLNAMEARASGSGAPRPSGFARLFRQG